MAAEVRETQEVTPSLADLLIEIRDELRHLNSRFTPNAKPESPLLLAILSYVGTRARFTASDLLEADDHLLRDALGEVNAFALGKRISALEGETALNRKLTKIDRGVGGNEWSFT